MEINKTMQDALNKQINAEFYSAYLYMAMSAYSESINLPGFANWLKMQAQEEISHGMKIYEYIFSRAGKVILDKIEQPQTEWKSIQEVFNDTYEHEKKVTELINNLVDLSREEKDKATELFLQWFVTEQVEEEDSADEIVQKLKRVNEDPNGLMILDAEMAKRVFNHAQNTETK
ncbi:ferritin [Candidatus Woesearchaeota archaeon]|jgi:ferritin|nr:ferritin [Candidatus Woesearchaeota archaeon]